MVLQCRSTTLSGNLVGPGQVTSNPGPMDEAAKPRDATAAIVGAGDYIGAAIARKFGAEGYTVFAGRRNGESLSVDQLAAPRSLMLEALARGERNSELRCHVANR